MGLIRHAKKESGQDEQGPGNAWIITGSLSSIRASTMVMLALVLAISSLSTISALGSRDAVPPGTHIADVSVGGLSESVALEQVQARTAALAEQEVSLTIDGQAWTPHPEELGIQYDAETSVAAALDHATPSAFSNGVHLGAAPAIVPLSIRFDAEQFHNYLDTVEAELALGPEDATITVAGANVTVVPAEEGQAIDRAGLQEAMLEQAASLEPMSVTAPLREQPAVITTEHATDTAQAIEATLAEPLTLTLDDQQWTLSPEQLGAAIQVEPGDDGHLAITVDPAGMETTLTDIAKDVKADPSDAWVQDLGTHRSLVPGNPGRTLDQAALISQIKSALLQGEQTLALTAYDEQAPQVTTESVMAELGGTDLIAVGDSVFTGSDPGRNHNVVESAAQVDGTLVPPGEVFSFNEAVGSLFDGNYREAGAYLDGPGGQALAGGVCQVSTTIFRAALDAGLPIVEWWPHSFRSPFYEAGDWSPGFDASIVQVLNDPAATTDFRFENTTDSWLLIRALISGNGELTVELHGADPGYTVEVEEPVVEVLEWAPEHVDIVADPVLEPGTVLADQPAMDGLRVSIVRHVSDADGQLIGTDTFVSTYGAYGSIRRVSPDMME